MANSNEFKAVGGIVNHPLGSSGFLMKVTGGSLSRRPISVSNVTGPGDNGWPTFSAGNKASRFSLRGIYVEGEPTITGSTYISGTKTISGSSLYSAYADGDFITVTSGGSSALYQILSTTSTSVTFSVDHGFTSTVDTGGDGHLFGGQSVGDVVIQLGNGEIWSGEAVYEVTATAAWTTGNAISVSISGQFTGEVVAVKV